MSNKMLKLLVVCGSLYRRNLLENICSSGSDISLEEDIKLMSSIAERIDVISLEKYNLPKIEFLAPNIYIHRVKYDEVELEIENIYTNLQNNSTDYLITQLLLCDIALQTAKKLRIKTIYYYRSFGSKLPIGIGEEFEPDKIVAVSQYAAKVARKLYKKNVYISYPKFIQPKDSRNVNVLFIKFSSNFCSIL